MQISLLALTLAASCSQKNLQQSGSTGKAGEVKPDTSHATQPAEYKQRIIQPTADQEKVDSLKKARSKRKQL